VTFLEIVDYLMQKQGVELTLRMVPRKVKTEEYALDWSQQVFYGIIPWFPSIRPEA